MADVILFHHALGLTAGVQDFAGLLRAAGHRVTVPDLYEGQIFDSIDAGVAHADSLGMDEIIKRGESAAADMPGGCVYAGFSLGSVPAQKLAQTRAGALGALLYHGGVPVSTFSPAWPDGVGLQIHLVENDKWAEIDVARQLAREVADCELCIYPGSAHLVADSSFSDHDATITGLILERSIAFLSRVG